MEEIGQALVSPAWWLSVVAAGIAVNLLAAFLKPRVDDALTSVSKKWGERTDKQRQERKLRIDRLRGNAGCQRWALARLAAEFSIAIFCFLLGAAICQIAVTIQIALVMLKVNFLGFYITGVFAAAVVFSVFGFTWFFGAIRALSELGEAVRSGSAAKQPVSVNSSTGDGAEP